MVKFLENTFRMINIGCDRRSINIWEVDRHQAFWLYAILSQARALGTLCIPIDLFYLSWKGLRYIDGQMPHLVVEKVQKALNKRGKSLRLSQSILWEWPISAISTNLPRSMKMAPRSTSTIPMLL